MIWNEKDATYGIFGLFNLFALRRRVLVKAKAELLLIHQQHFGTDDTFGLQFHDGCPDATTSPASGNAPTMALANPLQVTDPVSQRSVQMARELTPRPAGVRRPPIWRQPLVLAVGGLGGALLVLLGIWVIIRDKDGKEVGRIKVPEGGKAEIVEDATAVKSGITKTGWHDWPTFRAMCVNGCRTAGG